MSGAPTLKLSFETGAGTTLPPPHRPRPQLQLAGILTGEKGGDATVGDILGLTAAAYATGGPRPGGAARGVPEMPSLSFDPVVPASTAPRFSSATLDGKMSTVSTFAFGDMPSAMPAAPTGGESHLVLDQWLAKLSQEKVRMKALEEDEASLVATERALRMKTHDVTAQHRSLDADMCEVQKQWKALNAAERTLLTTPAPDYSAQLAASQARHDAALQAYEEARHKYNIVTQQLAQLSEVEEHKHFQEKQLAALRDGFQRLATRRSQLQQRCAAALDVEARRERECGKAEMLLQMAAQRRAPKAPADAVKPAVATAAAATGAKAADLPAVIVASIAPPKTTPGTAPMAAALGEKDPNFAAFGLTAKPKAVAMATDDSLHDDRLMDDAALGAAPSHVLRTASGAALRFGADAALSKERAQSAFLSVSAAPFDTPGAKSVFAGASPDVMAGDTDDEDAAPSMPTGLALGSEWMPSVATLTNTKRVRLELPAGAAADEA